jgi:ectoine hydroxylase
MATQTSADATVTSEKSSNDHDIYPSRLSDTPRVMPRLDPIVYGDVDDGPLSPEQLQQYDQNGFLILPDFLSPNVVESCLEEFARLCESSEIRGRPEAIIEPGSEELRSLFGIHNPEISTLFRRVAGDPCLVEMAMQILGGEAMLHQSRGNRKPGFAGQEFYWHSDFETWHVEDGMPRMRAVSCSILLTENRPENGPLMLVPQSHRHFVACVGETPDDHYQMSLKRQEYGVPDHDSLQQLVDQGGITSAIGSPGTVVLFDCNTMHGSNSNITPLPRTNLFFVYNSVANPLQTPFCGKKPRPEFIAARNDLQEAVPRCTDDSPDNSAMSGSNK